MCRAFNAAGLRYDKYPTFMDFEIMTAFLAMHAIAAPRGDGLRPELLALFERLEAASNSHLVGAVADQHRVDSGGAGSRSPIFVKLPHNQRCMNSSHPRE